MAYVICWCNHNEGFINAILTCATLIISIAAVWIAVLANRNQVRTGVLQQRLEVYYEINRIYTMMKQFSSIKLDSSLVSKRSNAYYILYSVGSNEFETCAQLVKLEKHIQSMKQYTDERHLDELESLKREFLITSENLVPSVVRENQLVDRVKSLFQLLYPQKPFVKIQTLLDAYSYVFLSHTALDNDMYVEQINAIKTIIAELESEKIMKKIQRETFS